MVCMLFVLMRTASHLLARGAGPLPTSNVLAPLQLDNYREQSELLDPLLERLVVPLAAVLQAAAAEAGAAAHAAACDLSGLRGASRLFWTLVTTRCAVA